MLASPENPFAYGPCEVCASPYRILLRYVGTLYSRRLIPLHFCLDCRSLTCIGDYVETDEQIAADIEQYTRNAAFKLERFGALARFLCQTLSHQDPATIRHADIGCGIGALVKAFADAGYRSSGFDRNQATIDRARHLFAGLPFSTDDAGMAGDRYDLVTLVDVLEHSKAPGDFMAAIVAALAPGGHLFVNVPRVDRDLWPYLAEPVDAQFQERVTTPFLNNEIHIVHFSSEGLARIGPRFGLKVVADFRARDWPLNGVLYEKPTVG